MAAKFIVWNRKWETGIAKIDNQHKHFIGIVNRAHVLDEDGEKKERLKVILTDLLEYARVHFSTEEEYFDETDYPETTDHEEKHQELLAKVIGFSQEFEKSDNFSEKLEEFLTFLRSWVNYHFLEVDHRYIGWLTEHGIK